MLSNLISDLIKSSHESFDFLWFEFRKAPCFSQRSTLSEVMRSIAFWMIYDEIYFIFRVSWVDIITYYILEQFHQV